VRRFNFEKGAEHGTNVPLLMLLRMMDFTYPEADYLADMKVGDRMTIGRVWVERIPDSGGLVKAELDLIEPRSRWVE
jgi:hypothetical protein